MRPNDYLSEVTVGELIRWLNSQCSKNFDKGPEYFEATKFFATKSGDLSVLLYAYENNINLWDVNKNDR